MAKIYSLDPPLRKHDIKKTGVVQRPGGPKKNLCPWGAPACSNLYAESHSPRSCHMQGAAGRSSGRGGNGGNSDGHGGESSVTHAVFHLKAVV